MYKSDYYAHKAKNNHYLARSVYKLEEIVQKSALFSQTDRVLDVGSAPGSWSQYVLEKCRHSHIVSVDLKDLSFKDPRLQHIQGDFLQAQIQEQITLAGPYDLIISDIAPNTTGSKWVDTQNSLSLVQAVFDLAWQALKDQGSLLVKIFQNGQQKELEQQIKAFFKSVRFYRPKAVKSSSFEVYLLGKNFKKQLWEQSLSKDKSNGEDFPPKEG